MTVYFVVLTVTITSNPGGCIIGALCGVFQFETPSERRLTHKSPGVLFLEFLHENWWKGVLLYQTIMGKAIFFSRALLRIYSHNLIFQFQYFL